MSFSIGPNNTRQYILLTQFIIFLREITVLQNAYAALVATLLTVLGLTVQKNVTVSEKDVNMTFGSSQNLATQLTRKVSSKLTCLWAVRVMTHDSICCALPILVQKKNRSTKFVNSDRYLSMILHPHPLLLTPLTIDHCLFAAAPGGDLDPHFMISNHNNEHFCFDYVGQNEEIITLEEDQPSGRVTNSTSVYILEIGVT